ncbi:MAG TPA: hypothetical protein VG253_14495 [Streptosporangiaceae bacterium]|nr:hypothetical protein [Streptosporangiaceae bacterium]
MLPFLMLIAVGALIAVAYIHFVKGQPTASSPPAASGQSPTASSSPSTNLGRWRHITTRAGDSGPLRLAELFPARFNTGGTTATRTIDRAGKNCAASVIGSGLASAVGKAHCTQVMRASYLSTAQKIMGTIGVLNLGNATAAEHAGKASGRSAFIKQLPAAHGPTHRLAKGTGLEEAVLKGHYLILIWAEFTNLHSPSSAARKAALNQFSTNLFNGTANVSLTSRMVTGKPLAP